jgi:transposase
MLTETQFQTIALHLPSKTKPPKYSAYQVLNGILFVMSSGCSWRQLPKEYGNWHTVYTRFKRWSESGVFGRILHQLHKDKIVDVRVLFLDSTIVRAHQSATRAVKKGGTIIR